MGPVRLLKYQRYGSWAFRYVTLDVIGHSVELVHPVMFISGLRRFDED